MLYFKHSELVKDYHVSLRTVHNWIDATKQGKLDLTLHTEGTKTYVANTARNISILAEIVNSRRKYRNGKAVKTITPLPEFYKIFNDEHIYEIASNLEIHHEIPRRYNYVDGGAKHWATYAKRLAAEAGPNVINSTSELLAINQQYLDSLLADYQQVNIISVGNAYPAKDLLAHLLKQGKMGRYIALDVSTDILEIAKQSIQHWFGDRIAFEGYECDISYDRFSHLLIKDYVKHDAKDTVNVVLLLGGALANMRSPDDAYKVIQASMGLNDLLIQTKKLDTEATRRFFDFNLQHGRTRLPEIHRFVVDLLNIDEAYYDVELGYNPVLKQRFEKIRLNVSIVLKLNFGGGEREIEFNKDSTILTWRAHQQTAADVHDQFARSGLRLLHSSQTNSQEYILTIARVKRD